MCEIILPRLKSKFPAAPCLIFIGTEGSRCGGRTVPKYPTKDVNYRIVARQRSRFTHYYFYIRDETLGPMVMRVASFLPFQTTYYTQLTREPENLRDR